MYYKNSSNAVIRDEVSLVLCFQASSSMVLKHVNVTLTMPLKRFQDV